MSRVHVPAFKHFLDPSREPVGWCKVWNRYLHNEVLRNQDTLFKTIQKMMPLISRASLHELFPLLRSDIRQLCESQRKLTCLSVQCIARGDFASKWKRTSRGVRERHLRRGVVWASLESMFCESTRLLASDVTLPTMLRGDGQGYLDLLYSFMLDNAYDVPQTPISVPNPKWKAHISAAECGSTKEAVFAYYSAYRDIFLCHILHATLYSFYGLAFDKPSDVYGRGFAPKKDLVDVCAELPKEPKIEVQQRKVLICESCRKEEDESTSPFMICRPCKERQNRRFYYCSRECQKNEWNLRHRTICAKAMSLADVQLTACGAPTPTDNTDDPLQLAIEDCDNHTFGLERPRPATSAAPPSCTRIGPTYEEIQAGTSGWVPGSVQRCWIATNPGAKFLFRVFRHNAVACGDKDAIVAMAQMLINVAEGELVGSRETVSRDHVLRQLTKEYGFDVEAAVVKIERNKAANPEFETVLEHCLDTLYDKVFVLKKDTDRVVRNDSHCTNLTHKSPMKTGNASQAHRELGRDAGSVASKT
ncbi:hypothetical protein C8R44DRAFT_854112 [Mycena epipterygia]|nr:hypothetical protein C8R44DRAFT_854112 [Mycena epipterygia]